MKAHLTSINDIAKALGISASTVSRALKDHPDISEATCKKVKEFAQKVNYRPNALALSLKKQVSNTIGVVIPEIVHHFFSSVISGIEDIAYSNGYRVMICQSNEDFEREQMNVEALMDHRVDGLLVCMSKSTREFHHFHSVDQHGLPIVFFDRVCPEIETDKIITDNFHGARMITSHLIEMGCRKILHLGTHQRLHIGLERFQGYLQALTDHNIPRLPELMMKCDTPSDVEKNQAHILKIAPLIDGIFAVNDSTAVSVMRLLRKNNFKVPHDIAVAGFGDDPVAAIVEPPLTTTEQQGYKMGQEALHLLINRITHKDMVIPPEVKVFQPDLKIRESSKKKPSNR